MKKKKDKIIYEKPPMKWDVALHKFVPDLSKIGAGKKLKEGKSSLSTK